MKLSKPRVALRLYLIRYAFAVTILLESGTAHAEPLDKVDDPFQHFQDPRRVFGVGIGGGYGWDAIYLYAPPANGSATTDSPVYPTLELRFFNNENGSWDLSLPIGGTAYNAAHGIGSFGLGVYYSPQYNTDSIRGILAPGFGFGFSENSTTSACIAQFLLRAGVELVGADEHFGIQFLAEPGLGAGVATAPGLQAVAFVFSMTGLIVVSLYLDPTPSQP
jgi:hypothetical protein